MHFQFSHFFQSPSILRINVSTCASLGVVRKFRIVHKRRPAKCDHFFAGKAGVLMNRGICLAQYTCEDEEGALKIMGACVPETSNPQGLTGWP